MVNMVLIYEGTEADKQEIQVIRPEGLSSPLRQVELTRLREVERRYGERMNPEQRRRLDELERLESQGYEGGREAITQRQRTREVGMAETQRKEAEQREQSRLQTRRAQQTIILGATPARQQPQPTEETRTVARQYTVTPDTRTPLQKAAQRIVKEPRREDFVHEEYPAPIRKVEEFIFQREKGYTKGLRKKPGKTLAFYTIATVAPAAGSLVGAGAAKVAPYVPKVVRVGAAFTSKVAPSMLLGYYGGTTGLRIAAEPKGKRVEKFGEIEATEITPLILGGVTGTKLVKTYRGFRRGLYGKDAVYKSRTEIESPEVRSGKEPFGKVGTKGMSSKQRAELQLKVAKKEQYVPDPFKGRLPHATEFEWTPEGLVGAGKREFGGGYLGLKGTSTKFTRVSDDAYRLYGGGLFQPGAKPAIQYLKPTALKTAPYVRKPETIYDPVTKTFKTFPMRFKKPQPFGQATIPGFKTEPETVVRTASPYKFVDLGKKYYTIIGGERIPLIATDLSAGAPTTSQLAGAKAATTGVRGYYTYSGALPKTSYAVSPEAVGTAAFYSTPGRAPSSRTFYSPSRTVSFSRPTPPSSRPRTPPRDIISYDPGRTPAGSSFFPSSTPSRTPPPSSPSISPPSAPSSAPPSRPPRGLPSYTPPTAPRTPRQFTKLEYPKFEFKFPAAKPLRGAGRVFAYTPTLVGALTLKPLGKAPTGLAAGFLPRAPVKRGKVKKVKATKKKKKKKPARRKKK